MKQIHLLLTGFSLTIVLLSINRLTLLTTEYLQPYEFLRWLDFNAMLPIPLLSIVLYYLLKEEIVSQGVQQKVRRFLLFNLILIVGIYLFGTSSGLHEITNYLNHRFCSPDAVETSLCNIIAFNDDTFSHYLYFIGFTLMNLALVLFEYATPRKEGTGPGDVALIGLNSLFIGAGIFANSAFEETGIDMAFFGSFMAFTLVLLYTRRSQWRQLPVTTYLAVAYTLGVTSTLIYKLF